MVHFFLQDSSESDALDIEIAELKSELTQNHIHTYQIVSSPFFEKYDDTEHSRQWIKKHGIPVGSLEFVQTFLREFHGVDHMNPIEIPKELRLPKFLLRDYQLIPYDNIPVGKYKFVKNACELKQPTFIGNTDDLLKRRWLVNPNDVYQVSDVLDILSEYRVVVVENKIYGIQFYDGDPTIMPTPNEIKKIKEMVVRYSASKSCPGAYTLDVSIIKTDNETGRDLALIECHPATSTGTYGCRGAFLPRMYELGFKWYIDHNTKIQGTL